MIGDFDYPTEQYVIGLIISSNFPGPGKQLFLQTAFRCQQFCHIRFAKMLTATIFQLFDVCHI